MPIRGTNITPRRAYTDAKVAIREMRAQLLKVVETMNTEAEVGADFIDRGIKRLAAWRQTIALARNTPNIDAYVQSAVEENDGTYVFTTEADTLLGLIDAAVTTIVTGMPTVNDGSNDWTAIHQYASNGSSVWRQLSTTAGVALDFKADLNAIIAEIT